MPINIHPIHQRMAEITRRLDRDLDLTPETRLKLQSELLQCLRANESLCTKMARIHNLSILASETNDIEWQHELCAEIEQLQS